MGHGKQSAAAKGPVYNVYSQEINPANMMPSLAQKPAPGQTKPLSTHRVQSSIPKGGTEKETWLFPSPQQFYNALVRKDKAENVNEDDMENVVAIHNAMNERSWKQLREWEERFHSFELQPGCPKLRRFMGKPFELSPKARVKKWLGLGEPFDRHDWFVDRGDGKEVRYVLDYYYDSKLAEQDTDPRSTRCIVVDVRPAVDSAAAVWDRLRAFPGRMLHAATHFRRFVDGSDEDAVPAAVAQALGGGRRGAQDAASSSSAGSAAAAAADEATERLAAMGRKCNPLKVRLAEAKTEEERSAAFISLTYCMATGYCKSQADAFMAIAERGASAKEEEQAFTTMRECVIQAVEDDVRTARE